MKFPYLFIPRSVWDKTKEYVQNLEQLNQDLKLDNISLLEENKNLRFNYEEVKTIADNSLSKYNKVKHQLNEILKEKKHATTRSKTTSSEVRKGKS